MLPTKCVFKHPYREKGAAGDYVAWVCSCMAQGLGFKDQSLRFVCNG